MAPIWKRYSGEAQPRVGGVAFSAVIRKLPGGARLTEQEAEGIVATAVVVALCWLFVGLFIFTYLLGWI